MGISMGMHYTTTKDSEGIVKCVPTTPGKIFTGQWQRAVQAGNGDLIMEFPALPKKCYPVARPSDVAEAYWWTDAEFLPNDDSVLFVTAGAFRPRTNQAWIHIKHTPLGKIIKYHIGCGDVYAETFPHSMMSNYPKVQIHPSGQYIAYSGAGELVMETIKHEAVLSKPKDMRMCNYRYCALSPNGKYIAILLSVSRKFELMVSMVDKISTLHNEVIDLSRTFKGFEGSNAYNEHIECKWSPDSQHIAVCSSIRFMVVVDCNLQIVSNVSYDILPNNIFPSFAGTFDFDPRSCHEILAVGANDSHLYVVNTHSKEIIFESQQLGEEAIDCLRYNPQGTKIGISLRNFTILLIDSSSGTITFQRDMRQRCPHISSRYRYSNMFPSVMRLSFSSTGNQLATSSVDGFVRIWQLPVEISLKSLCRFAVLCIVAPSKVEHLPLPTKVKEELLFFPRMK